MLFSGHRARSGHDEIAEDVDVERFTKNGVDHGAVEPANRGCITGGDDDDCRAVWTSASARLRFKSP